MRFELPEPGIELPASSLPALTAARAAVGQGAVVFATFHLGLFAAHFRDNLDIGRADVLWRLAEASGLDMARFRQGCDGGEPYRAVLEDYAEAAAWFGVSALPTVIFNGIEWMLAGEPGGLIPLDFTDPPAGAAGQSAVRQAEAP